MISISEKVVYYVVITVITVIFLQSLRDVAVQFIKSTEEKPVAEQVIAFPGGLMMPSSPAASPHNQKYNDGSNIAGQ